jgi:pyruvate/2-oxoglutarate dehydrogenase complex dihydrolipoamide acyltransferase (E2) component
MGFKEIRQCSVDIVDRARARVVDGATAADFLRTLKNLLEEPATQLL